MTVKRHRTLIPNLALIATLCASSVGFALPKLSVAPTEIRLEGPRQSYRLLVTLVDATGARDQTETARFESANSAVAIVSKGRVMPRGNGSTDIIVTVGKLSAKTRVVIANYERPDPVDFHSEVIAALSRGGCSQGA